MSIVWEIYGFEKLSFEDFLNPEQSFLDKYQTDFFYQKCLTSSCKSLCRKMPIKVISIISRVQVHPFVNNRAIDDRSHTV